MWNWAIIYRARSMASVIATAGDSGRVPSVGRGEFGFEDTTGELGDWCMDWSAGVGWEREICGSANWIAGGRLVRHWSS